jgi:hypothetical protein
VGSFDRHFRTVAHRGSAVTGNIEPPLSGPREEFVAAKSSDRHMANIPLLPFGSTFDCIGLEGNGYLPPEVDCFVPVASTRGHRRMRMAACGVATSDHLNHLT